MSLGVRGDLRHSRRLPAACRWRAVPTRGFSPTAPRAHGISPRFPRPRALPRRLPAPPRHRARKARAPQGRDARRPRAARRARPARDDVYLALLTGNYEGGARLKLEYFDLWRYFRCGAFGDEAPHRNGLVPKAVAARRGMRRAVVRGGARGRDRRYAARRRVRGVLRRAIDGGCDRQVTASRSCARREPTSSCRTSADTEEVLRVIADLGLRTAD